MGLVGGGDGVGGGGGGCGVGEGGCGVGGGGGGEGGGGGSGGGGGGGVGGDGSGGGGSGVGGGGGTQCIRMGGYQHNFVFRCSTLCILPFRNFKVSSNLLCIFLGQKNKKHLELKFIGIRQSCSSGKLLAFLLFIYIFKKCILRTQIETL